MPQRETDGVREPSPRDHVEQAALEDAAAKSHSVSDEFLCASYRYMAVSLGMGTDISNGNLADFVSELTGLPGFGAESMRAIYRYGQERDVPRYDNALIALWVEEDIRKGARDPYLCTLDRRPKWVGLRKSDSAYAGIALDLDRVVLRGLQLRMTHTGIVALLREIMDEKFKYFAARYKFSERHMTDWVRYLVDSFPTGQQPTGEQIFWRLATLRKLPGVNWSENEGWQAGELSPIGTVPRIIRGLSAADAIELWDTGVPLEPSYFPAGAVISLADDARYAVSGGQQPQLLAMWVDEGYRGQPPETSLQGGGLLRFGPRLGAKLTLPGTAAEEGMFFQRPVLWVAVPFGESGSSRDYTRLFVHQGAKILGLTVVVGPLVLLDITPFGRQTHDGAQVPVAINAHINPDRMCLWVARAFPFVR